MLVLVMVVLELVVLEVVVEFVMLELAVLELVLELVVLEVVELVVVEFMPAETKFRFDVPLPPAVPELEPVELLVVEWERLVVEGISAVDGRAEVDVIALSGELMERGSIAPRANSRTSASAIPATIVAELARRSLDEPEEA